MSERLRADPELLGAAYHDLFRGEDSEFAEAAAFHLAETLEAIRATVRK